MLLMPAPDGSIDGAAITRQSNALMFKQEDQLAKFFGPDLKPAWDRYREANSRRQGAESLARAIEANAERLRPDQVQALASILQQAQQDTFITHSKSPPARIPFDGSPEAMNAMRERAHRQVEARDARILQLAKPILSRRQLASLDQVLSSHRFWAAKARAN
jgi:hypothetical protein